MTCTGHAWMRCAGSALTQVLKYKDLIMLSCCVTVADAIYGCAFVLVSWGTRIRVQPLTVQLSSVLNCEAPICRSLSMDWYDAKLQEELLRLKFCDEYCHPQCPDPLDEFSINFFATKLWNASRWANYWRWQKCVEAKSRDKSISNLRSTARKTIRMASPSLQSRIIPVTATMADMTWASCTLDFAGSLPVLHALSYMNSNSRTDDVDKISLTSGPKDKRLCLRWKWDRPSQRKYLRWRVSSRVIMTVSSGRISRCRW